MAHIFSGGGRSSVREGRVPVREGRVPVAYAAYRCWAKKKWVRRGWLGRSESVSGAVTVLFIDAGSFYMIHDHQQFVPVILHVLDSVVRRYSVSYQHHYTEKIRGHLEGTVGFLLGSYSRGFTSL